jgi:exodeoxyribonuclease-3
VDKWDLKMQEYLNDLKEKKNVVWCGDLNVAHKDIDIYKTKGMERLAGFTPQERKSFSKFL